MNKIYEVLEVCLNDIEQGADVDTVLFRYPDLAMELRPILEASVKTKEMAVPAPTRDAMRRSRARLLQRAAEMREQKSAPASRRIWSVPLRRALVTLMIVAMLFVSGTGLVRASSTTLPGDNLYPVKRTFEGVRLFFTFNTAARQALEIEHENERLNEVNELISQGRSANVEFAGYVKSQSGTEWQVDGVVVMVSPQTGLPDQPVAVGDAVRVQGQVQSGGFVVADKIELLAPGAVMPDVEDHNTNSQETENSNQTINETESENSNQSIETVPVTGSENETPEPKTTSTPIPTFEPKNGSLDGTVNSIENDFVVINGIVMDISLAEINGTPQVGAVAKAEGFYDANGIFIVTKIEFEPLNSTGGETSTPGNTNENTNVNVNVNNNGNTNSDNTNSGNTNNSNDNSNTGNDH